MIILRPKRRLSALKRLVSMHQSPNTFCRKCRMTNLKKTARVPMDKITNKNSLRHRSIPSNLKLNIRQRCANSGRRLAIVNMRIPAPLRTEVTSSKWKQIFQRITKPSCASDSTSRCTVHMGQGANSFIMNLFSSSRLTRQLILQQARHLAPLLNLY